VEACDTCEEEFETLQSCVNCDAKLCLECAGTHLAENPEHEIELEDLDDEDEDEDEDEDDFDDFDDEDDE
jgi:hypothetical protein